MYQYILFDLDGTLTNSKEGITKCVQYALKHFNIIEEDLEKLVPFIGPPLVNSFETFYGMSREDALTATEQYRVRFKDIGLFENYPYEGIDVLLEKLVKSGKTLAVATSKPEIFTHRILEKFDLAKYFTVVAGSEIDGTRNEKSEVIEEAFRRLKLSESDKNNAIMVGDRLHDVIGAKKFGIPVIGVQYGFAEEGELLKNGADYIVNTVEELGDFLLKNERA